MNIVDCLQGDALWFESRIGVLTSSRIADAVAKLKRKQEEAACRRNLRMEMACELMTGRPSEHYVSRWMEEGKDKEPLARAEYELKTGVYVEQVGFVLHPTIKNAGASPDGLVGKDGLLEIKCPKLATHLQYLIADTIPEEYIPQMLWQMCVCEREWNDFVSYHPEMPAPFDLFVCRLNRSKEANELISVYELEAVQFLKEVDEMLDKLKASRAVAVKAFEKGEDLLGSEWITQEDEDFALNNLQGAR